MPAPFPCQRTQRPAIYARWNCRPSLERSAVRSRLRGLITRGYCGREGGRGDVDPSTAQLNPADASSAGSYRVLPVVIRDHIRLGMQCSFNHEETDGRLAFCCSACAGAGEMLSAVDNSPTNGKKWQAESIGIGLSGVCVSHRSVGRVGPQRNFPTYRRYQR